MRLATLLLAVVLALAAAGCGGGDDEAAEEPAVGDQPPAATEVPEEDAESGEAIFVSSCGGCHTLSAAGTSGTVGPPLDDHGRSQDEVEQQVRQGGGQMPAFEGTLSPQQIEAVAAYVAEQGGGDG